MNFFVYFMHFVLCTIFIVHLCAIDTRLINATCLLAYTYSTYISITLTSWRWKSSHQQLQQSSFCRT